LMGTSGGMAATASVEHRPSASAAARHREGDELRMESPFEKLLSAPGL
jgi:hypothetical protein